jgi:hypothetical protein
MTLVLEAADRSLQPNYTIGAAPDLIVVIWRFLLDPDYGPLNAVMLV